MAQEGQFLPYTPDDLSLISGTYRKVERDNQLPSVVPQLPQMSHRVCEHSPPPRHIFISRFSIFRPC